MHRFTLLAVFIFTFVFSVAVARAISPYGESIRQIEPMSVDGLDSDVANVLRNYYKHNFTDAHTWNELESIRFDGTLHLAHGVFRFTAYKKKPDFIKVLLYPNQGGGRIVMAHDGVDAWKLNTLQPGAQPEAMPPKEALNFIRDASTGGHILYPLVEGKQIELLGTTTVDDRRLYDLRITLPDGQQIRSQLDQVSFAEVRQITINHINGHEEITTHSDFREIDGLRIPFMSTLTVDGQQVHQSRIGEVQINAGALSWMFSRPSGIRLELSRSVEGSSPIQEEALFPALNPSFTAPRFRFEAPGVGMDPRFTDSVFQVMPAPAGRGD